MSGNLRDDRAHGNDSGPEYRTAPRWPHAASLAVAAAALAAVLTACGGSSGSSGTTASTSSGTSTTSVAPSATPSAAAAGGGSIGCLAGTWRSTSIRASGLNITGGAGGVLTISGNGAFVVNYSGIQPMTFTLNGLKGSMTYSGQATGQLRVNGSKLSGTTRTSTFAVKSDINGTSFKLPLPKVVAGASAPWQSFTCSGNTLALINPTPAATWNWTRTS